MLETPISPSVRWPRRFELKFCEVLLIGVPDALSVELHAARGKHGGKTEDCRQPNGPEVYGVPKG